MDPEVKDYCLRLQTRIDNRINEIMNPKNLDDKGYSEVECPFCL